MFHVEKSLFVFSKKQNIKRLLRFRKRIDYKSKNNSKNSNRCIPIRTHVGILCKKIAQEIGYDRMLLLKNWDKAIPIEYRDSVEFSHLSQKRPIYNKTKDVSRETLAEDDIILHLKCINSSIGLIFHYEKINILEKIARIIGSRKVVDIKLIK